MRRIEPEPSPPDIVSIRPAVTGVFVTLACRGCGAMFESLQPEVAGVHVGVHRCPRCAHVAEVMPEAFTAALQRLLPPMSVPEMVALTEEAGRIANTWHEGIPAGELAHGELELAPPAQLYLMSYVMTGLLLDTAEAAG